MSHSPTTHADEVTQPKRVQWASKTRVNRIVEDDEPRSLDEHALDPAALARLQRALESYQPQPSTSSLLDVHDEDADVEAELAETKRWENRARDLVRAHTSLAHKTRAIAAVRETPVTADNPRFSRRRSSSRTDQEKRNEHAYDLEANATPNIGPLPLGPGRGVLSTLLALYDARSASASSTNNSATTTRSSSPFETLPSLPPASTPKKRPSFHIPLPTRPHALHLPSFSRPKAARNSGGVVGSLVATSRNITGAAAPAPSSVGPSVGRPGWGLTRYSFAPEDTLHCRTHSAPAIPLQNSRKEYFDGTDTYTDSSTPTPARTPPESLRKVKRSAWYWIPQISHPSSASANGSRASSPERSSSLKGVSLPSYTGHDASAGQLGPAHGNGQAYRRGRKDRRRKAEIFITKHIAEIIQRQEFLLKFARALMMFAAPTHRLQAQLQATARVLDLETSSFYLPNVLLIAFGDDATGTSNLKFIQQPSTLDLGKLLDAHRLYWKVIHDKISVSSASASLDLLMNMPSLYREWQLILIGGMCSAAICPLAFSGSFVDALMAMPLGALLVLVQLLSSRNELYSNVFEITIATLLSFISAGLASTSHFCYAALASSSVVLILPGFFVLSGSLELSSRQIVSGAVRIGFAVIYSLFLGFGISMGAEVYSRITGLPVVGPDDVSCASSHRADGPWWQRTASIWWAFLCVPLYSLFLSLRNHAPLLRKELPVTLIISCGGWAANHFAGIAFAQRPDIQSAVGAFAVGIVANMYARFFSGNAYVVMITGILFQLPTGLANGGLLTFAAVDNEGQQFQSYQAGFQVALQLVAVAIGLTVGLFTSVVVVHPLGGSRRRAAGLFSL